MATKERLQKYTRRTDSSDVQYSAYAGDNNELNVTETETAMVIAMAMPTTGVWYYTCMLRGEGGGRRVTGGGEW